MNTLNLYAAAKNLIMVDTIYGRRKASRRFFRVTRKIPLSYDEGTRVRLIGSCPDGEPNIDKSVVTVNALQGESITAAVPIDALEADI